MSNLNGPKQIRPSVEDLLGAPARSGASWRRSPRRMLLLQGKNLPEYFCNLYDRHSLSPWAAHERRSGPAWLEDRQVGRSARRPQRCRVDRGRAAPAWRGWPSPREGLVSWRQWATITTQGKCFFQYLNLNCHDNSICATRLQLNITRCVTFRQSQYKQRTTILDKSIISWPLYSGCVIS